MYLPTDAGTGHRTNDYAPYPSIQDAVLALLTDRMEMRAIFLAKNCPWRYPYESHLRLLKQRVEKRARQIIWC